MSSDTLCSCFSMASLDSLSSVVSGESLSHCSSACFLKTLLAPCCLLASAAIMSRDLQGFPHCLLASLQPCCCVSSGVSTALFSSSVLLYISRSLLSPEILPPSILAILATDQPKGHMDGNRNNFIPYQKGKYCSEGYICIVSSFS